MTIEGDQTVELCNRTHLYEDITFNTPIKTIAQNGQDFKLVYSDYPEVGQIQINMASTGNNCISKVGALSVIYPRHGTPRSVPDPDNPGLSLKDSYGVIIMQSGLRMNKLRIQTVPGDANSTSPAGNHFGKIEMIGGSGTLDLQLSAKFSGISEEIGVIRATTAFITTNSIAGDSAGEAGSNHKNRIQIGEIDAYDFVSLSGVSGVVGDVQASISQGRVHYGLNRLEGGIVECSGIEIDKSTLLGTELIATTTGFILPPEDPKVVKNFFTRPDGTRDFTETFVPAQSVTSKTPYVSINKSILVDTPIKTHDLTISGSGVAESFNYDIEFVRRATCENYGFMAGTMKCKDPFYIQTTKTMVGPKGQKRVLETYAGPILKTKSLRFASKVTDVTTFVHEGNYVGSTQPTIESNIEIEPVDAILEKLPSGNIGNHHKYKKMDRSIRVFSDTVVDVHATGAAGVRNGLDGALHIKGTLTAPRVGAQNFINYGTIVANDLATLTNGINYGTIRASGFNIDGGYSGEPDDDGQPTWVSNFINSGVLQYFDGSEFPHDNP